MRFLLTLLATLLPLIIHAARPVTSAYTVEAGSSHISDTYLTPLRYEGWHAAIDYERFQAMRFDPGHWIMRLNVNTAVDRASNPAHNATMWNAGVSASWAMMRRWTLPWSPGLRAAVGGITGIEAGALYLARNGNNPVSARAAWTIGVTAMATWSTRVWGVPITLRYQPSVPLTGVFFAPDYGELYYEISLGNRSGLVHAAWPGNRFVMQNLVTVDLRFGATALRVGYSGRILSGKVNGIVTRTVTHAVTVGVSGEWLSINPGHPGNTGTPDISAFY